MLEIVCCCSSTCATCRLGPHDGFPKTSVSVIVGSEDLKDEQETMRTFLIPLCHNSSCRVSRALGFGWFLMFAALHGPVGTDEACYTRSGISFF